MLTKVLSAVVLVGALWVAGDAAYKHFGCCHSTTETASTPRTCCLTTVKKTITDCCSTQSDCCSPAKECCLAVKTSATANQACCAAQFSYCTRTDTVYEGCCCEVVNGQFHCLVTGIVSDECCCIPLGN